MRRKKSFRSTSFALMEKGSPVYRPVLHPEIWLVGAAVNWACCCKAAFTMAGLAARLALAKKGGVLAPGETVEGSAAVKCAAALSARTCSELFGNSVVFPAWPAVILGSVIT